MLATGRTWYILLIDEILHLLLAPRIDRALKLILVLCTPVLDKLIRSETLMAFLTIHKRVCKAAKMS